MFGGLFGLVGLLAVGVTVLVVLLIGPADGPLTLPVDYPGLARLRRVGLVSRALGMVAGIGMLVLLGRFDHLGQALVLVPAVFAAVQLIGVLATEVVTHRDARRPGVAGVEIRRIRDYLPRRLAPVSIATALVLAVVIGWTTWAASPDGDGRAGRAMAYRCNVTANCDDGSFSPWPGSFYTVPLTAGLLVVLALAAVALLLVVLRPRNGAEAVLVAIDDTIRRQSVSSVVAASLFALAGSLAGLGLTAGPRLLGNGDQVPTWFFTAGVLLTIAGTLALGAFCWSIAALLRPLLRPSVASPRWSRSVGAVPGQDGRR